MFSDRDDKGTKKWDRIVQKGNNDNERAPAVYFWPTANNISAPVSNVGGAPHGDGVKKVKTPIKRGNWYHIAVVITGTTQNVYINGDLSDSAVLPGNPVYTVSPIVVGPFDGKIKDLRFSNFALSKDEVVDSMGRHPDYKVRNQIMKLWRDAGCVSNPFSDFGAHSDWVELYQNGNTSKLEDMFRDYKSRAEKGDKKLQKLCFGPFASKLYNKLNKSTELLKYATDKDRQGKKCLPMAPFTCKNKSVNDFDIRTHKDFYKYTRTDKIIPPASSADDIKLEQHPDFTKFQR